MNELVLKHAKEIAFIHWKVLNPNDCCSDCEELWENFGEDTKEPYVLVAQYVLSRIGN